MAKTEFIDYYKLLQVHYDASPEVIKAAYIKLTKVYHPDSSGAFSGGIELLNEAFAVLKDPRSRNEYHKKWLEHFTGKRSAATLYEKGIVPGEPSMAAAKDTLDLFFRYLCIKEWDGAYQLLTTTDKSRTSYEDFEAWREAVAALGSITKYAINYANTIYDCEIDGTIYKEAIEFNVEISEVSARTGETSTSKVKKCCAYDGVSWKVWLGAANIKALTLRFRLEAEHGRNIDSMALYHSAVNRIDPLTGLLSELGFVMEFEEEAARMERYHTPVTIAAFRVVPEDSVRASSCVCQAASIIRDGKRRTDKVARLNNDVIVCLLTETKVNSGELAARKFAKLIDRRRSEKMSVYFGVISFTGAEGYDAVLKRASEATVKSIRS